MAVSFEDAQKAKAKAQSKPYTLLRNLKPNLISNDVVKDLIPRRALGEVHADSGGGKTAIMVDLGLHIAAGMAYRGRRVEQQPVIFVALEGHGGIENRIIAAAKELGVTDAPFALVKSSDNFRDPETARKVAAMATELIQEFGGDNPIVMIDTYTAALGAAGSDCDPKDVSEFINAVQTCLLTMCTVIVLHHFGKDAARGSRGWSGLRCALDFEIEIDRADDLRTMRVTKSRDGSDQQAAFCYHLVGREVGVNNHGEVVTAVVVEHLADEEIAKRGKKHSPKARAALNVLWECIKDNSRSWPMADEPGLRCTMMAVWEKACAETDRFSQATDQNQRRRRFRDAAGELETARAIVRDGERVYPAPKPRCE